MTLLTVCHLVLAGMLLGDLGNRKKILGGKKAVWAIVIPVLFFIGSLAYFLCHPRIFLGKDDDENDK